MIPEGWDKVKVGDHCKIILGATPARKNEAYWDTKLNSSNYWVAISDLSKNRGRVIFESQERITDKGVQNSSVKLIEPGTIIMSFKLSIGKAAIAGRALYTNEAIAGFVPTNKKINNTFLFYALPYVSQRTVTDRAVKGATLNKKKLSNLRLLLPPVPEQKKIAAILSSVDEAIEATEAVIEQTRTVKKGLLQELLTRGIGHTEFKKTAIGEIPKSWNLGTLDNVGEWYSGGTPARSKNHFWDGSIPWISPKDMKSIKLKTSIEKITRSAVDEGGAKLYPPGTILIVVRGMILAHSAPVGILTVDAAFNQDIKGIIPKKNLVPEFLTYWLEHQKTNILNLVAESTHGTKRIPTSNLRQLPVVVPSLDEQHRIVSRIRTIDEMWSKNETLKSSLINLKKGLLQDLLTGKVRVNTLDLPALLNAEAPAEAQAE